MLEDAPFWALVALIIFLALIMDSLFLLVRRATTSAGIR